MPCVPVPLLRRLVLLLSLLLALVPLRAEPELSSFELRRQDDEGLLLSYSLRMPLPTAVEEALLKGVPLHFLTEVEVYRERWYWRDERVARQSRAWRLAWQPLSRRYRLSLGGFSQQHDRLDEALAAVLAASRWQIVEPGVIDDGSAYRVEFSFQLDTSRLPRPLQFSVDREDAWELELRHRARLLPRESR